MRFSKPSSKALSSLPSWTLLLCNWGPLGERICQTPFTQDTVSCISPAAVQTEGHEVRALPHPPVSLTTSPPFLISPQPSLPTLSASLCSPSPLLL